MPSEPTDQEAIRLAAASGLALTTAFVLSGVEPIRLVVHHEDGTWDFFCNTTDDERFIRTVHVVDMFQRYPELTEVKDLPPGHLVERQEPGDPWLKEVVSTGD